jgi:phosphate transport system substrate-binding protein
VKWPTGAGAEGTDGIVQAVRQTRNSIGYGEYGQAVQSKLSFTVLQNGAGRMVAPDARSFQAAAASADWKNARDFDLMLTGAPGEPAYPIVATVYAVMRKDATARRTRLATDFFRWSLERGVTDAAELGYVPLPRALVEQVTAYWAESFKR